MNLSSEIQNYRNDSLPNLKGMEEYCKSLSFEEAIKNASSGKNSNRKMNSHQWRVGSRKCEIGANELFSRKNELKKCNSFEEIFRITEKIKREVFGLGDLWSYDAALRIGFNIGLYPKEVYVQAGVLKGVKKALNCKGTSQRSLPINIFPEEIQQLEPYQVENFLCVWGRNSNKNMC